MRLAALSRWAAACRTKVVSIIPLERIVCEIVQGVSRRSVFDLPFSTNECTPPLSLSRQGQRNQSQAPQNRSCARVEHVFDFMGERRRLKVPKRGSRRMRIV